MKNQKEIVARFKSLDDRDDFFGAERENLLLAMTFETAEPFLTEKVKADPDLRSALPRYAADTDVLAAMHDYLSFAYSKAYNQRGLSANRSVSHFLGWSFLVDDALHQEISGKYDSDYRDYGLHILRVVDQFLQARGFAPVDPYPNVTTIP